MRIRRNVATASERTMFLDVYADGVLCDPAAITVADLLYDPGTGAMVAASGTLTNRTKPLVVADLPFTTTHATETINADGHGLSTGDGPVRVSNSGGGLPAGYLAATDYWWITTDADHGQLAASLAQALAGTPVPITTDGSGAHTLSDTASTRRLRPGQFLYTFTQAETNVTASWVSITTDSDAVTCAEQTADIYLREMDEILVGPHTRADIERLMLAVEAGPTTGFVAGTINFFCPITGTLRLTATLVADGRSSPTFIVGTLT